MIRSVRNVMAAALCAALAVPGAQASEACNTDAMIVFDGSGSMGDTGAAFSRSPPRIVDAREALRLALPAIAPFRRVGLISYGPGARTDRGASEGTTSCAHVRLHFAPEQDAGPRLLSEIDALQPQGETPLTEAVAEAARVLDYRTRPGLIVLVTDGLETCGGAPCALAGRLASEAHDLTMHVIGFKVRRGGGVWGNKGGNATAMVAECLPAANGGSYFSTRNIEELVEALEVTMGCQQVSSLRRW